MWIQVVYIWQANVGKDLDCPDDNRRDQVLEPKQYMVGREVGTMLFCSHKARLPCRHLRVCMCMTVV